MLCPLKSCQNGCHCVRDYGVFAAIVVLSLWIFVFKLNQPVFLLINSMHFILPVHVWQVINFVSAPKHFILPILLLLITWQWKRTDLVRIIPMIVFFYILFYVLKILVGEARPFMVLAQNSFYLLPTTGDMMKDAYHSFPSGHTGMMTMFSFAILQMFMLNSKLVKGLLYLFPVIVGVARIATGWHWPLDVLVSGLLGYLTVVLYLWRIK